LEVDQDNLHVKFSELNVHFINPILDSLRSRRPMLAGIKDGYPPKELLFYHHAYLA